MKIVANIVYLISHPALMLQFCLFLSIKYFKKSLKNLRLYSRQSLCYPSPKHTLKKAQRNNKEKASMILHGSK